MSVEIIESFERMEQIAESWNTLFQRDSSATFFQSYVYNRIAWSLVKKIDPKAQLFIITIYDKPDELIVLLPCYIDRKKYLRFINDIHTDFCDGLFADDVNDLHHLFDDIYKIIEQEKRIKFLFLDNIRGESPLLPYLKVLGKNSMIFSQTEHTMLFLPPHASVPTCFTHLRSKERAKLKKIQRDMSDIQPQRLVSSKDLFPEELLRDMWQTMIRTGIRSADYLNDKFFDFSHELYEAGLLEIVLLRDATEKVVACGYYFVSEDKFSCMQWVILCTEKRFNLLLDLLSCQVYSSENALTLDFGRGGYFYKIHNFKPTVQPLFRLLLSKTIWGNLYILYKVCISHLRKTFQKYHE